MRSPKLYIRGWYKMIYTNFGLVWHSSTSLVKLFF